MKAKRDGVGRFQKLRIVDRIAVRKYEEGWGVGWKARALILPFKNRASARDFLAYAKCCCSIRSDRAVEAWIEDHHIRGPECTCGSADHDIACDLSNAE